MFHLLPDSNIDRYLMLFGSIVATCILLSWCHSGGCVQYTTNHHYSSKSQLANIPICACPLNSEMDVYDGKGQNRTIIITARNQCALLLDKPHSFFVTIKVNVSNLVGYVDFNDVRTTRCGEDILKISTTEQTSKCVCRKHFTLNGIGNLELLSKETHLVCLKVAAIKQCSDSECVIWVYFSEKIYTVSVLKPIEMCSATQLIGFNYAFFYMTQMLPSITPTNATTITTTYMTPTVITPSSTDAGLTTFSPSFNRTTTRIMTTSLFSSQPATNPTTPNITGTLKNSTSTCVDQNPICSELFPGECTAGIHLKMLCPRACGICDAKRMYCADNMTDCNKMSHQCSDAIVESICPFTCNTCDSNNCDIGAVTTFLTNITKLSHPSADFCSDGTRTNMDAIVLSLCGARTDKTWTKGRQVTLSCDLIPLYTPVSSFGSFSHEIGLFLGCTKNGFKIGVQRCDDNFKETILISGDTTTILSDADVYHVLIVK